jgi:hypothetical protein
LIHVCGSWDHEKIALGHDEGCLITSSLFNSD